MIRLAPYQRTARDWLLHPELPRKGLWDEQGVGKTFPSIAAVLECPGPRLITVPAYLIPNWRSELERYDPAVKVVAVTAESPKQKEEQLNATADVILCSYNLWSGTVPLTRAEKAIEADGGYVPRRLRPEYSGLHRRPWSVLAFDEAHRLRSRNSIWTNMVYKVWNTDSPSRGARAFMITGTPLVRDGGDMYPLAHIFDRKQYSSYWTFVERRCHVEESPWDRVVGKIINPDAYWEEFQRYGLRRFMRDIPELRELEHTEKTILVDLPATVHTAMTKAKKEYVLEHPNMQTEFFDAAGALVNRLRTFTSLPPTQRNPKYEVLREMLVGELTGRVIVWCWYRDTAHTYAEKLRKALEIYRRPVFEFTGDESPKQKQAALEGYDAQEGAVIVATIGAMKEGANLQKGSHMVFVEDTYLPTELEQCVGRQKRRGQKDPVHVYHIRARRSPDIAVAKVRDKREQDIGRAMRTLLFTDPESGA